MTPEPSCKDEARVGQQGTLTRLWARRGSRPPAPKDCRYKWAYIFGAVCPARGTGAALVLPYANAAAMNLHLTEISRCVARGAHAVVTLDGAGWHQTGDKLCVPPNISLLLLPSYAPELNPQQNIWQFLRQNYLANRVYPTYDAIVTPAATPGTGLQHSQTGSLQSLHDPGQHRSQPNAVGIRPQREIARESEFGHV